MHIIAQLLLVHIANNVWSGARHDYVGSWTINGVMCCFPMKLCSLSCIQMVMHRIIIDQAKDWLLVQHDQFGDISLMVLGILFLLTWLTWLISLSPCAEIVFVDYVKCCQIQRQFQPHMLLMLCIRIEFALRSARQLQTLLSYLLLISHDMFNQNWFSIEHIYDKLKYHFQCRQK